MQNDGYIKGDAKLGDGHDYSWSDLKNKVFLPHSCDEWIIGGRDNVAQMISDLQDLLNQFDRLLIPRLY